MVGIGYIIIIIFSLKYRFFSMSQVSIYYNKVKRSKLQNDLDPAKLTSTTLQITNEVCSYYSRVASVAI